MHEQLFQSVGLVAHAQYLDVPGREIGEQLVDTGVPGDVRFQGGVIHPTQDMARNVRQAGQRSRQVQYEGFHLQLVEQLLHAGILDHPTFIDDGDVAAQVLRLLEVMGGEDDGGALLVDGLEKLPHGMTDLDVHAGGGFVEDQQARAVYQGTGDHQPTLHATGQVARHAVTLLPQAKLFQVLLGPRVGLLAFNTVVAALVDHDLHHRLEHIEIEFLRHQSQLGLGGGQFPVQVMAEDGHLATGLVHQ